MGAFQKLKETIRVKGTADAWFGKCCLALEKGQFWVVRADRSATTFEARYRGYTIDGNLRATLTQAGDKVVIEIVVSADCDSVFALFADPRTRILNAFTTHLWDKTKRRTRGSSSD
jgi:hypothetical protein